MSRVKLQFLMFLIKTRHVSKCDLKHTCEALPLRIRLASIRKDGDTRVGYYGRLEAEDHFNLGLHDDHELANSKTTPRCYSLEDHIDVMFIEYCNINNVKDGEDINRRA